MDTREVAYVIMELVDQDWPGTPVAVGFNRQDALSGAQFMRNEMTRLGMDHIVTYYACVVPTVPLK